MTVQHWVSLKIKYYSVLWLLNFIILFSFNVCLKAPGNVGKFYPRGVARGGEGKPESTFVTIHFY